MVARPRFDAGFAIPVSMTSLARSKYGRSPGRLRGPSSSSPDRRDGVGVGIEGVPKSRSRCRRGYAAGRTSPLRSGRHPAAALSAGGRLRRHPRARRQLLAVYSAAVGDISAGIGQWGPACGTWLPQDWEPSARQFGARTDRRSTQLPMCGRPGSSRKRAILEMVHRLCRAAT